MTDTGINSLQALNMRTNTILRKYMSKVPILIEPSKVHNLNYKAFFKSYLL